VNLPSRYSASGDSASIILSIRAEICVYGVHMARSSAYGQKSDARDDARLVNAVNSK
jgi:hypothetical protein